MKLFLGILLLYLSGYALDAGSNAAGWIFIAAIALFNSWFFDQYPGDF